MVSQLLRTCGYAIYMHITVMYKSSEALKFMKATKYKDGACSPEEYFYESFSPLDVCVLWGGTPAMLTFDGTSFTRTDYTDVDCTQGATQIFIAVTNSCNTEKLSGEAFTNGPFVASITDDMPALWTQYFASTDCDPSTVVRDVIEPKDTCSSFAFMPSGAPYSVMYACGRGANTETQIRWAYAGPTCDAGSTEFAKTTPGLPFGETPYLFYGEMAGNDCQPDPQNPNQSYKLKEEHNCPDQGSDEEKTDIGYCLYLTTSMISVDWSACAMSGCTDEAACAPYMTAYEAFVACNHKEENPLIAPMMETDSYKLVFSLIPACMAEGSLFYEPAQYEKMKVANAHEADWTCGDVKFLYKKNECCGNPEQMVSDGMRRLATKVGGDGVDTLLTTIGNQLDRAKMTSNAKANTLAARLLSIVKEYED